MESYAPVLILVSVGVIEGEVGRVGKVYLSWNLEHFFVTGRKLYQLFKNFITDVHGII